MSVRIWSTEQHKFLIKKVDDDSYAYTIFPPKFSKNPLLSLKYEDEVGKIQEAMEVLSRKFKVEIIEVYIKTEVDIVSPV